MYPTAEELLRVDKTFCINLDSRPDRWSTVAPKLRSQGFANVERVSAVVGKDLDINTVPISNRARHDLMHHRDNHYSIATMGAIGCALSHKKVWQRIVDENLQSAMVFEDDIYFVDHFRDKVEILIRHMQHHGLMDDGILMLNSFTNFLCTPGFVETSIPGLAAVTKPTCSTAAYRITQDAAKFLLSRFEPIEIQVDAYMTFLATNPGPDYGKLRIWAARPILVRVTPVDALTGDIQTLCIKCLLPTSWQFYSAIVVVVVLMIFYILFLLWRNNTRRKMILTESK